MRLRPLWRWLALVPVLISLVLRATVRSCECVAPLAWCRPLLDVPHLHELPTQAIDLLGQGGHVVVTPVTGELTLDGHIPSVAVS